MAVGITTTGLIGYLQVNEGSSVIPWWAWFVLVSVLLVLLLIGYARQTEPGELPTKPGEPFADLGVAAEMASTVLKPAAGETKEAAVSAGEPEEMAGQAEPTPEPPDDLKRIQGIGPKIASVLDENGISTFAALAAADPEQLQTVLDEADIRLAHPGTWPEQANLAAAGKWTELEELQSKLKGGREK